MDAERMYNGYIEMFIGLFGEFGQELLTSMADEVYNLPEELDGFGIVPGSDPAPESESLRIVDFLHGVASNGAVMAAGAVLGVLAERRRAAREAIAYSVNSIIEDAQDEVGEGS